MSIKNWKTEERKEKMSEEVFLPKAKTMEGADLLSLVWLVYGQPGIGKTTFASKMGNPLFLYTDPGQRFVNVYKRPITDWLSFKRYMKLLDDNRPKAYSTIVIDTVDILYNFCKQSVYKKRGIEHASDEEWGKGWELINDEFTHVISRLCLLPYGVVFISHVKEIEIRGRLTRTNKLIPSLQKQGLKVVLPMCDIIAFCGFDESSADKSEFNRLIQFEPTETIEAKDRTGLLPDSCKLSYPEVENFLLKGGIKKESALIKKDKETKTKQKRKKKVRR